jgi:hypothetical protein
MQLAPVSQPEQVLRDRAGRETQIGDHRPDQAFRSGNHVSAEVYWTSCPGGRVNATPRAICSLKNRTAAALETHGGHKAGDPATDHRDVHLGHW